MKVGVIMMPFDLNRLTDEEKKSILEGNNKFLHIMYKIRTIFTAYKEDSIKTVHKRLANEEDDFCSYQEEIETKLRTNGLEFTVLYFVEDNVECWACATIKDLNENKIVFDMEAGTYEPGKWENTLETLYASSNGIISVVQNRNFETDAGREFWRRNETLIKDLFDKLPKHKLIFSIFGGETAVVGDRLIIEKGSDLKGDEYSIYDLRFGREVFNVFRNYSWIVRTYKPGDWEEYLLEYEKTVLPSEENREKTIGQKKND